jgi:hypothetical protein
MEEFQRASENLAERVAKDEHLQILTTRGLFGDLLERPFWKRIWIVQEVVLGKSVTIICGPDEIPWQKFLDATWTLSEAFSSNVQNIGRNSNLGSLGNLINIDSFRALKNPSVRASIGDVVACLRQSNATDPRDMIWSEALLIIGIYKYSAIFMNTYTFLWNLRILWLYRRFHKIFSKKSKGINNSIYY